MARLCGKTHSVQDIAIAKGMYPDISVRKTTTKRRRALTATPTIDFYRYQISFKLLKS